MSLIKVANANSKPNAGEATAKCDIFATVLTCIMSGSIKTTAIWLTFENRFVTGLPIRTQHDS